MAEEGLRYLRGISLVARWHLLKVLIYITQDNAGIFFFGFLFFSCLFYTVDELCWAFLFLFVNVIAREQRKKNMHRTRFGEMRLFDINNDHYLLKYM